METSLRDHLKTICENLVLKHPEAMGIAYMELDCGCVNICGVSAKGDPVGELRTISERLHEDEMVCLKCFRDKKIDWERVIAKGFIWPGDELEKPDEALLKAIGKRVFG